MKYYPIGDVQVGMVTHSDCLGSNGNLILEAGTTLSEQWITLLKDKGVTGLEVVDQAQPGDSATDLIKLQTQIKEIFSPVIHRPHMTPLAKATYQFLKNKPPDSSSDD